MQLGYAFRGLLLLAALCPIACGSDDDTGAAPPIDVAVPQVEGPVSGGREEITLQGTTFPLGEVGYRSEEYFVTGSARSYSSDAELTPDGRWHVDEASTADYRTRVVVYRPIDDADFSGMVFVEWFNVSASFDSAPDWISSHVELMRRGYIYVGVSAQQVAVEGPEGEGPIPGLDFSLKNYDPERYGSLTHPGDSFSYDIFAQVGAALRQPEGAGVLPGVDAEYVIAAGQSQSASRLLSYVNALANRTGVFDAFLIHSRGRGGSPLSQQPLAEIRVPQGTMVRTDVAYPVLTLQAEGDVFNGSYVARQGDSTNFRWWEVSGTSHADLYTLTVGMNDRGDDPGIAEVVAIADPIPGIISCDDPINSGPLHFVLKAAIRSLELWLRDGTPAAGAPLLATIGDDPPLPDYDDLGNSRGGIRTPYVDVPTARLLGELNSGSSFCRLFGKTILYSQEMLAELYPDHDAYVAAVEASAQDAIAAGFLLPEDAEMIVTVARDSEIGS